MKIEKKRFVLGILFLLCLVVMSLTKNLYIKHNDENNIKPVYKIEKN